MNSPFAAGAVASDVSPSVANSAYIHINSDQRNYVFLNGDDFLLLGLICLWSMREKRCIHCHEIFKP
jgi:hypothetical protein